MVLKIKVGCPYGNCPFFDIEQEVDRHVARMIKANDPEHRQHMLYSKGRPLSWRPA